MAEAATSLADVVPPGPAAGERQSAVIDLGSNSFRLEVFSWVPQRWWKRTDEIYDPVRIGRGLAASGALGREPMQRALETIELYAHFCRSRSLSDASIDAVATSAIRDASNGEQFLAQARGRSKLPVRVLSAHEEARYGHLAGVNSTTLRDGLVLDLGGGSVQLVLVRDRRAAELGSWPLGSVRMTERFLGDGKASRKELRALRAHVRETLDDVAWLADGCERMVGLGGTIRNLAAAAQREAQLPSFGVQGQLLTGESLGNLVDLLAGLSPAQRSQTPGIKPERGDVILAGAVVIEAIVRAAGAPALEVTEAGLREGIFFTQYLAGVDPPLFEDVRSASIGNLARQYHADLVHVEHVAKLALEMFDALAAARLHAGDPLERELLWAAAMLHDIGVTVDYDDHHRHSRYLILNAGLPGFAPREVALIAQLARYHRKGTPTPGPFAKLMDKGDDERLARCTALLRLAEQLDRSRDQAVRTTRVGLGDGHVTLRLLSDEDVSVARWAAERHADVFELAFGRALRIEATD